MSDEDLRTLLATAGLENYFSYIRDNGVDYDTLISSDPADLRSLLLHHPETNPLGLKMGDMLRLLKVIRTAKPIEGEDRPTQPAPTPKPAPKPATSTPPPSKRPSGVPLHPPRELPLKPAVSEGLEIPEPVPPRNSGQYEKRTSTPEASRPPISQPTPPAREQRPDFDPRYYEQQPRGEDPRWNSPQQDYSRSYPDEPDQYQRMDMPGRSPMRSDPPEREQRPLPPHLPPLRKISPTSGELVLLLLSQSGVGKSTFVNALKTFVEYPTLDNALEDVQSLSVLTSIQFTSGIPPNQKMVKLDPPDAADGNEVLGKGQSSTQMPRVYTFPDIKLSIIDTPGIGDNRGVDQDVLNMDLIIDVLDREKVAKINGILLLLKPNEARLNINFQYCLRQLLLHLHRDATQNIVFCFPHASGTGYQVGDTITPLLADVATLNSNLPSTHKIRVTEETVFCFDNNAFASYAASSRMSSIAVCPSDIEIYPFLDLMFLLDDKHAYEGMWDFSRKTFIRLLSYCESIPEHKADESTQLHGVRQLLEAMAEPLAICMQKISLHEANLKAEQKILQDLAPTTENLRQQLLVTREVPVQKDLGYPRTVCADRACTEVRYYLIDIDVPWHQGNRF